MLKNLLNFEVQFLSFQSLVFWTCNYLWSRKISFKSSKQFSDWKKFILLKFLLTKIAHRLSIAQSSTHSVLHMASSMSNKERSYSLDTMTLLNSSSGMAEWSTRFSNQKLTGSNCMTGGSNWVTMAQIENPLKYG